MPVLDEKHPLCPLCLMEGDRSIKTDYKGKTYYFCSEDEKAFFDKHLDEFERFLADDAASSGRLEEVGAGSTWHEPMAASGERRSLKMGPLTHIE